MYRQSNYNRGGWRGGLRGFRTRQPEPEGSPAPPLGARIETITTGELSKSADGLASCARVTNCSLIASYNWLDRAKPSILIPGAPARWTPLADPVQLREDSGTYYRDKNAARYPAHPMEPAIQAILAMHPEPLEERVDIVACGSTMGNLLRFVRGEDRPFRMLVEVVGDTVHLIRRENSPKETIPGVKGYGHTFPEANTTWDTSVRGSASHQRILRYDFGGLCCVVRHEGDGFLRDKTGTLPSDSKRRADVEDDSIEALTARLDDEQMSQKAPVRQSQLHIQSGGFEVPQSAVFDLKTRSCVRKGQDFLGQELPRMWVAQIPSFILAYHSRGVFNDVEIMDVSEKVKAWERTMNRELSLLAALLHRIIDLVRDSRHGRLELNRQALADLEVRAQTPGLSAALSAEMMAKWESWLASAASEDEDDTGDEKGGSVLSWSDGEGDEDYTACSKECSYCGRCTY
ncbi:geranylgeranyl pyrophosphate synthetase [Colletotrichum musicola]|uniref:Geranylgeranyl pyrophosphate synthetase n=1 Tax=Colletotrichum musicola TaxID=2175873 RepID=A0A8H6KCM2_9PEZI|nr:geranylgeranyl pyrophosphate synthetase [Colletotrichum musicola]